VKLTLSNAVVVEVLTSFSCLETSLIDQQNHS